MWPDNTNGDVSNGTVVLSIEDTTVTKEKVDEDVETNWRKARRLSECELLVDTSDTMKNTLDGSSVPMDSQNVQEQGREVMGSAGVDDNTQQHEEDSHNTEADTVNSLEVNTDTVVEIESSDMQTTEQSNTGTEQKDVEVVLLDTHRESDVPTVNKPTVIESSPVGSDTNEEKKPRKRKLTATNSNRFCVEQVSLESKSSLKKSEPSESLSSLHESTSMQQSPMFYVDTDLPDNTGNDDNDGNDDVFDVFSPDGLDNPGYSANNDEPSKAVVGSVSTPGLQSTHIHPLPLPPSNSNGERVLSGRKDSVIITKHKLKHKPKLLKYDESVQQWVERNITVDRAPSTPPRPNDHLPMSCAVLLFCNVCFGIAALFFALRSNSSFEKGEYDEAKRSSRASLILSIIGVLITILLLLALLIYFWPTISN